MGWLSIIFDEEWRRRWSSAFAAGAEFGADFFSVLKRNLTRSNNKGLSSNICDFGGQSLGARSSCIGDTDHPLMSLLGIWVLVAYELSPLLLGGGVLARGAGTAKSWWV